MDASQGVRYLLSSWRRGRRSRDAGWVGGDHARQRRRASTGNGGRDGVQHSPAHCAHLGDHDAASRRRHRHGDAGGSWAARPRRPRRSRDSRDQSCQQSRSRRGIVPPVSARVRTLPDYPLAAIPQRKRDLLARGVDVIDLGAGDADLAPPPAVMEALGRAARDPRMSRYGFGLGLLAFREAVSAWMTRRFGLSFDPLKEVVPLIGSKEGIAHTAFGFAEPGDVCVIPEPGYLAYLGGAMLADATPHTVALRPRAGFLLDLDQLPRDVLANTRIVYVNYPNN